MPEIPTIGDDALVKSREAAAIELTPFQISRTSSENAIGVITSAGSPALVETNDVVSEEFPTGARLYTIFLALALAVLIVGLVCIRCELSFVALTDERNRMDLL